MMKDEGRGKKSRMQARARQAGRADGWEGQKNKELRWCTGREKRSSKVIWLRVRRACSARLRGTYSRTRTTSSVDLRFLFMRLAKGGREMGP